jgi:hypothetical protein
VHRETAPGQDVWVVGSGPALGDWDLGKAVALKWTVRCHGTKKALCLTCI